MNDFFKNKFSFAFKYFSNLIEKVKSGEKEFPQGLIFEGNDTKAQYLFTLELARLLNCKKEGGNNCDCINCRWIKSFSHPAINNVSEIHYKSDDDKSKTVISAAQAKQIENSLAISSDYHRFFIFFSSRQHDYSPFELNDFKKLGYNTNIDYSFEPLTYNTFSPTTLNALLKPLEEPPKRTTFVFLTRSKEEILQTVASRCFTFKLNSKTENDIHFDIPSIFANYPNIDYIQAIDISNSIQNEIIKNPCLSLEDVLNGIIEYIKRVMLENIQDNRLYSKFKKDINIVNTAIKEKNAAMADKIVLEAMMLKIARGY